MPHGDNTVFKFIFLSAATKLGQQDAIIRCGSTLMLVGNRSHFTAIRTARLRRRISDHGPSDKD